MGRFSMKNQSVRLRIAAAAALAACAAAAVQAGEHMCRATRDDAKASTTETPLPALGLVSSQQLIQCATEAIEPLLQPGRGALRIASSYDNDLRVGREPVHLRARPAAQPGQVPNPVTVWVDVLANTRLLHSVPIQLQLRRTELVWVASRDLQRGQTVSASDFVPAQQETLAADKRPFDLAAFPSRIRLRTALRPGDLLDQRDVKPVTAVVEGDTRWVSLNQGLVSVQRRVEIAHDALPGQHVRLRVDGSARPLYARVMNDGQLEVLPR